MYSEEQELADWKRKAIKRMFREQRIQSNMNMFLADRAILITMERLYPEILEGKTIQPQLWYVAREAGVSKSSISRFLSSMYSGGYFAYNTFLKTKLNDGQPEYSREVFIKELESCKHAENINTIGTPRRKKDKKKAMERIKCRVCGSENMLFKLTLVCRDCGLEQE